jgi:uncharacterized protein YbjT (DUF2867 family)
MLAIVGASGKIGGATLSSLLDEHLITAEQIICTTSSGPDTSKWSSLVEKGVHVRHATFDDPASMETAFAGCDRLFLVSSPRIAMDFFDAPLGSGREKDHFVALEAAKKAGVKHIFYTSLAFANPSKSNVMTAHARTEERLRQMEQEGMRVTILREGLYNESWPLYFGHYDVKGGDGRSEVLVAGDGKVSWTAIADLGLANALVLAAPEEYEGKSVYLSNTKDPKTLKEIAGLVSEAKGKRIALRVGDRNEHERFYIEERKMNEGNVRWWAATYAALNDGECEIEDTTFERLLSSRGRKPKLVEETVKAMLS